MCQEYVESRLNLVSANVQVFKLFSSRLSASMEVKYLKKQINKKFIGVQADERFQPKAVISWGLKFGAGVGISGNFPGTRYPPVPKIFFWPLPGTHRYPKNFADPWFGVKVIRRHFLISRIILITGSKSEKGASYGRRCEYF